MLEVQSYVFVSKISHLSNGNTFLLKITFILTVSKQVEISLVEYKQNN